MFAADRWNDASARQSFKSGAISTEEVARSRSQSSQLGVLLEAYMGLQKVK